MKTHRWTWLGLSLLLTVGALGCAANISTVSATRFAGAAAAIRASKEAGAAQSPRGSLHLRLAEEQYREARRMIRVGEPERADRLLVRARMDAELARSLAREDAQRRASERAQAQFRATNPPTASRP